MVYFLFGITFALDLKMYYHNVLEPNLLGLTVAVLNLSLLNYMN